MKQRFLTLTVNYALRASNSIQRSGIQRAVSSRDSKFYVRDHPPFSVLTKIEMHSQTALDREDDTRCAPADPRFTKRLSRELMSEKKYFSIPLTLAVCFATHSLLSLSPDGCLRRCAETTEQNRVCRARHNGVSESESLVHCATGIYTFPSPLLPTRAMQARPGGVNPRRRDKFHP